MSGDPPATGLDAAAVVRRWWQAARAGSISPELWDEGLRIDNMAGFPITGPYNGHAGLRQWWADIAEVVDGLAFEVVDVVALDETHVLSEQRMLGRFSTTAIPVDARWASLMVVKDGKIAHASGYASRAHALRAAARQGLGEGG